MKVPTEEQIEAVISELEADACSKHPEKGIGDCETCKFLGELDKRGTDHPTQIDSILLKAMENNPVLGIVAAVGGVRTLCDIMRAAFFVGVKCGVAQETSKQLEELMEK